MAHHIEQFECLQSLSEICCRLRRNPQSREDLTQLRDLFNTPSNGDFNVFTTWFQLQDRLLPLECLWQLQSSNLLQFTTYIIYNANMIPDLTESFLEQIWCENEAIKEDFSESVAGLLGILINLGINTSRDISRIGQELLTLIIEKIFKKLSPEEVVNELHRLVTSQEPFNWQWLLTAVSAFIVFNTERTELLTEMIEMWFTQSCNSKNTDLLSAALLCARQCCAENAQRFGSYSTWFCGLQIRHASSFIFFYNFLSYLVPYEPALCLKIHVNKVPSAPANCHSTIKDYTTLAKTRLSDLNQTADYVGLFGEYVTTEQEGREADVAKVISNFKQTNEISKIVLEASVFRRQFYENVFLAELLKDNNTEHIEFIERLNSLGRIPHALYNKWRQLYS